MTYYQKYLEILRQGATIPNNPEAKKAWREKVWTLREKSDEEHTKWVKKVESQWLPGEWDMTKEIFEKLTLPEIRELTDKLGIKFNVEDESVLTKQDFVLVLDETDKKKLFSELKKLGHRLN